MRFAYDLASAPSHSRLRVLREMIVELMGRPNAVARHRILDDDFTVAIKGWRSGDLMFAQTSSSKFSIERTGQPTGQATEESLVFGISLDHVIATTQDGRETQTAAGEACFFMKHRPHAMGAGVTGRRLAVHLPKRELVDRFGPIDDLTATTFSSKLPLLRLATNFFVDLANIVDNLDDFTAERLVLQGLDLLALAMSEQVEEPLKNTTVHRSASLFRLKNLIASRLKDPNFSLAEAAAAFGVSPRYVNSLLATQATSFGRFVLEERLKACHRDLCDPRQLASNIIDIAYRWGFNDPAHFSRSFKARFGSSPRDFRHNCFGDHQNRARPPLVG